MKIPVGQAVYDCSVCARTVIRFWQRWGVPFRDEWYKADSPEKRDELLKKLFYVSAGVELPFAEFSEQADADHGFSLSASALRYIIFECNLTGGKRGADYGIPNDEVTFLARILISGIPDAWLDQFKYYELHEIMQRQSLLQDPATYETEVMSESEQDAFYGITKEKQSKISEYIKAHPEEFQKRGG